MSPYEMVALLVLGVLGVANALKAAERARATLQIATMYHAARENDPESLGPDSDQARKKVQGFLQKTIWASVFHAANLVVCGALGWSIWRESVQVLANWQGVILVLCLVSAFGCVGAVWELVSGLLGVFKDRRLLEDLGADLSDEQRAEMQLGATVPLGIAQYVLTGIAAAYLVVVLFRMSA